MDRIFKLACILAAISVVFGAFAHRLDSLGLFAISLVLIVCAAWYNHRIAIFSLVVTTPLIYIGATSGWLYGRDSHITAFKTVRILSERWPLPNSIIERGFTGTPLLHFFTGVAHRITGLPIQAGVAPRITITAIVPLIFTYVIFGLVVATSGRLYGRKASFAYTPGLLLLWIPLYFNSGFRRKSIGLVIFCLLVWRTFRQNTDKSFYIVGLFTLIVLPLAHHVTSIVAILFLAVIAASRRNRDSTTFSIIFPIYVGFTTLWYFYSGFGGEYIVLVIFKAISNFDLFSLTNTLEVSNRVETPFYVDWRVYYSKFFFLLMIGTSAMVHYWYNRNDDQYASEVVVFGVVIVGLAVVALFGSVLSVSRVATFWVIVAAVTAPPIISTLQSRAGGGIKVGVVVVAILLSFSMVQPVALTGGTPAYTDKANGQTFSTAEYAMGDFAGYLPVSMTVYGDPNTEEMTAGQSGVDTAYGYTTIQTGKLPPDSAIILHERNQKLYWGLYQGAKLGIDPIRPFSRIGSHSNRVYDNRESVYFINSNRRAD